MAHKSWTAGILPLLGITASLSISASAQNTDSYATCYVLNGAVSIDHYFRCDNTTTGHSSCCQAGWTCWSNGVCEGINVNGNVQDYTRSGCTDPTWEDPVCLSQCQEFNPGGGTGIRPCDGITKSNRYCCDDGRSGPGSFECCNNESDIFTVGNASATPGIIATIPVAGVSSSVFASSVSLNTPSFSTSTSGLMISSSQPVPTTALSDGFMSSVSNNTAPMTGFVSSPTSSGIGSARPHEAPNPLAVGIGVGLGIGLPAAAAVVGIVILLMKRLQSAQQPREDWMKQEGVFRIGMSRRGIPFLRYRGTPSVASKLHELPSEREPGELSA
ncbi:hypothetical protein F5Y10DRAFT_272971 [Nemania abortiva]|nr:hypothetical protein F5Y10DRAFT_272971 [Nemania abortiva]